MKAVIEATIKFDGETKGHKMGLEIPSVLSKWLRKDGKNMAKWEGLLFDRLRREFPGATVPEVTKKKK